MKKKEKKPSNTKSTRVRSFTSFQMFHTHASLPRGCFAECVVASEALIQSLKQDIAIDAKSKYREEICK